MIDFAPDAARLSSIFYQAAAPAFFLGAVAGLISILTFRLSGILDLLRRREPSAIDGDLMYLLKRAGLLHSAIRLCLAGGLSTILLLALSFIGAFFQFQHIYGAALLFLAATALVGLALLRFFQEVRVSLEAFRKFSDAVSEGAAVKMVNEQTGSSSGVHE